jgi:ubiquinone/menaquinone biosynthesis C-methylase UbiE
VIYSWGDYEEMYNLRYVEVAPYIVSILDFPSWRGKRVLDVGCGGGMDAITFAINGAESHAIDYTRNAVDKATELAKTCNVNVNVQKMDARRMMYPSRYFDLVSCQGVLHHIPDVEEAVNEIYRVLKKGGRFIVMLYNRNSLLYHYSILFLRGVEDGLFATHTEEEILRDFSEAKRGCPYTKVYTEEEAKNLFKRFHGVTTEIHHNVYDTRKKRKVKFDGPPHLGWHIIVRGEK